MMLARIAFQATSNKLALPSCQARKLPSVTQITQMNASNKMLDAMPSSNAAALTPDAAAERESLSRVIPEPEGLQPLLCEAAAAADPEARVRFRYDWLRKDLERVRQGIQEHIDAPRAEPRAVAPLRGDYRH